MHTKGRMKMTTARVYRKDSPEIARAIAEIAEIVVGGR